MWITTKKGYLCEPREYKLKDCFPRGILLYTIFCNNYLMIKIIFCVKNISEMMIMFLDHISFIAFLFNYLNSFFLSISGQRIWKEIHSGKWPGQRWWLLQISSWIHETLWACLEFNKAFFFNMRPPICQLYMVFQIEIWQQFVWSLFCYYFIQFFLIEDMRFLPYVFTIFCTTTVYCIKCPGIRTILVFLLSK